MSEERPVPRRESPWSLPEGDKRQPKAHRCNDRVEDVVQACFEGNPFKTVPGPFRLFWQCMRSKPGANVRTYQGSINYAHQKDIQLCKSWEHISIDPSSRGRHIERITEHYRANCNFEFDRNINSLEHRWGSIKKECIKFQAAHDQVEDRHPSSVPYQEHIRSILLKHMPCILLMNQRIRSFRMFTVDFRSGIVRRSCSVMSTPWSWM